MDLPLGLWPKVYEHHRTSILLAFLFSENWLQDLWDSILKLQVQQKTEQATFTISELIIMVGISHLSQLDMCILSCHMG